MLGPVAISAESDAVRHDVPQVWVGMPMQAVMRVKMIAGTAARTCETIADEDRCSPLLIPPLGALSSGRRGLISATREISAPLGTMLHCVPTALFERCAAVGTGEDRCSAKNGATFCGAGGAIARSGTERRSAYRTGSGLARFAISIPRTDDLELAATLGAAANERIRLSHGSSIPALERMAGMGLEPRLVV